MLQRGKKTFIGKILLWNFTFLCGIAELEKLDSDNGASPKDLGR